MIATDLDMGPPLRAALLGEPTIADDLGTWNDEPCVFTRRPVPADAPYPMIVIGPDAAIGNQDFLISKNPVVTRDVVVYGLKGAPGAASDQTRVVEALGYRIRALLHQERFAITASGMHVVDIACMGPMSAPTDDDKLIARAVPVTISLQQLA